MTLKLKVEFDIRNKIIFTKELENNKIEVTVFYFDKMNVNAFTNFVQISYKNLNEDKEKFFNMLMKLVLNNYSQITNLITYTIDQD